MTERDPITPASAVGDRAATAGSVADDMAAIFGVASRHPAAASVTGAAGGSAPWRRRPAMLAALAAGALAIVVGGGVIAGGSAIGVPATADAGLSPARPKLVRSPVIVTVAGPVDPVVTPVTPTMPAPAIAAPVIVAAPVVADRAIRPAPVAAATLPAEAVAAPQAVCDDEDACLAAQVDVAERDIADAYAQASDAGVRGRLLRGYRDEWLRARDDVDRRPREALRRYAMMTSDLHNLSDDAAAARPAWR